MTDHSSTGVERKLAAILSADVVGYSRLMAEDEAGTVRTLTDYREVIATLIRQHRGRVVDSPGDNLLAEFPSALDAVHCAIEIQRVVTARNADLSEERKMEFRIGVHLGDVMVEGERIYGDGVNIAARLEGLAEPGGICISQEVHGQVATKLDLRFHDLGEQSVKNIPKPVRAYQVQLVGEVTPPMPPSRRRRAPAAVVVAVLVFGGVALGLWGLYLRPPPQTGPVVPQVAAPEISDKPSIAVLPFVNMSGDPEQEYFSDGITEEIITELSRFRELLVVGRSSTFRYKGQPIDPRKVGRELGVHYVLEGSVRRAEDTIRVTAQLLDANTGTHVWAETYDRDLTTANLFAVQDEVAGKVVGTIGSSYGVITRARLEETRRSTTESLDAYDCALRAEAYYATKQTPDEHFRVRECLERAVELDPDFALAWTFLTFIYLDEYRGRYNPRPDSLDRALEAARRAVELDPSWTRARRALAGAYFFRRELDLFFIEAERTLALDPGREALAFIGCLIAYAGQWDRGVALVEKAIALTTTPFGWYYLPLSLDHYRKGEYKEALAAAQKSELPEFFWTHTQLAMVYGQLGDKEAARSSIAELQRLKPDFTLETAPEYIRACHFADEEFVQHQFDGLRKAGLKE
jgi:adenylate cyclase